MLHIHIVHIVMATCVHQVLFPCDKHDQDRGHTEQPLVQWRGDHLLSLSLGMAQFIGRTGKRRIVRGWRVGWRCIAMSWVVNVNLQTSSLILHRLSSNESVPLKIIYLCI